LLDSHAFIWAMTEPERLPEDCRTAVTDPLTPLLLSTASIWEIAAKVGRGRWPEAARVIDNLEAALMRAAITALPVSVQHARAAGRLVWEHRDPFDRMLAAQAIGEGAILVTADRVFAGVAVETLWR
jgi:PIN domain nuclease of toxin-antitoxin system